MMLARQQPSLNSTKGWSFSKVGHSSRSKYHAKGVFIRNYMKYESSISFSGHLVFFDWPEKHKLSRGRWNLASCQVPLNSVWCFQKRSRKFESIHRTDGQCTMTIAHLSLRLRWAKNSLDLWPTYPNNIGRQNFSCIHNAVFHLLSLPTSGKTASLEWTPCYIINQTMTWPHD